MLNTLLLQCPQRTLQSRWQSSHHLEHVRPRCCTGKWCPRIACRSHAARTPFAHHLGNHASNWNTAYLCAARHSCRIRPPNNQQLFAHVVDCAAHWRGHMLRWHEPQLLPRHICKCHHHLARCIGVHCCVRNRRSSQPNSYGLTWPFVTSSFRGNPTRRPAGCHEPQHWLQQACRG